MTAEIDLLPLPEWMSRYTIPTDGFEYGEGVMLDDCMRDYARANVARNTALLRAEIEALRAERDVLARENEAMKRCATKYLGWLGVAHMPLDEALREDMSDPTMCGDAAIAAANGGGND